MLDAGDALAGGDRLGDRTQGEAIVAGMNLMGYNATAVGPKELALGLDVLRQRMAQATFPFLSANVVLDDGSLLAQPYAILPLGEQHVAIVGLTRPPAEPGGEQSLEVLDPVAAAARYIPEVSQQVETVILLTNLEVAVAQALAGAVPGIDLVIAGLPEQPPDQAVRVPGTGTLVVAADQSLPLHTGRRVGELRATVNRDGSLSDEFWTPVPMSNGFADDQAMQALLAQYDGA